MHPTKPGPDGGLDDTTPRSPLLAHHGGSRRTAPAPWGPRGEPGVPGLRLRALEQVAVVRSTVRGDAIGVSSAAELQGG